MTQWGLTWLWKLTIKNTGVTMGKFSSEKSYSVS